MDHLSNYTRKLGPLPLYVWAILAVGGAYALWRIVGGGSSGAPSALTDPYANSENTQMGDASADSTDDDSSRIGLASGGADTPIHVVIDNPAPNLYTPSNPPPNIGGGTRNTRNGTPPPNSGGGTRNTRNGTPPVVRNTGPFVPRGTRSARSSVSGPAQAKAAVRTKR